MRKKDRPWVLFDADDTLIGLRRGKEVIGTNKFYEDVLRECVRFLDEEFGSCSFEEVLVHQQRVHRAILVNDGFRSKDHFQRSFRHAYRSLCFERGEKYDRDAASTIEEIASVVTATQAGPLPGALEVLARVSEHYRVAVVTKGNYSQQRRRVFEAGCRKHVSRVIVMSHKSLEEWKTRVIDALNIDDEIRSSSFVVGDSIKSDINPALALGFNAIHVESHAWEFEKCAYVAHSPHKLSVVPSVTGVLDIIPL